MNITQVHGSSMLPSLHDGHFIALDPYTGQSLAPGDIVAFMHPSLPHASIKRILALPGQHVMIHRGLVLIDGQALPQQPRSLISSWEAHGMRSWQILPNHGEIMAEVIVPHEHFFCMGDNRSRSLDSRHYESVSLSEIRGVLGFNKKTHVQHSSIKGQ